MLTAAGAKLFISLTDGKSGGRLMAKQIAIRCPAQVAQLIIDALKWFIERNYPTGADECSIAARDALYDLAGRFERELLANGESTYSIRMRAFLCEAVRSYLVALGIDSGVCHDNRRQVLIDVCRGNSDGADFDAAAERDAAANGPGPDG
jgi:hypothetical protein